MADQEHDKDIWAESGEEDNVYERKLAESCRLILIKFIIFFPRY